MVKLNLDFATNTADTARHNLPTKKITIKLIMMLMMVVTVVIMVMVELNLGFATNTADTARHNLAI